MRLFFWRRRRQADAEFLRTVIHAVTHGHHDKFNFQPPKKREQPVDEKAIAAKVDRAFDTLKTLLSQDHTFTPIDGDNE